MAYGSKIRCNSFKDNLNNVVWYLATTMINKINSENIELYIFEFSL